MPQQGSHIPKFGSWDADNVPYTAYFENARKDKGTGVMINPNDPEQNPEAFMKYGGYDDGINDIIANEKSSNSNSLQSHKSDQKRSFNSREKRNKFSPPSSSLVPNKPKFGYNPADDVVSHRSASVPMFGAWDEKNPKSAEGFTVIFQKVKEEKHIAATNFPPIPQQPAYTLNTPKNKTRRPKVCIISFFFILILI
ncbi:hypothetical protein R6Q59_001878 [Mikania micrantha]